MNGYSDNPTNRGTVRNIFTRAYFNANATYFKSMKGQHTFKTGMRFERFGNDVLDGAALPNVSLFWGQTYTNPDTGATSTGKYGYYTLNQTGTIGKVNSNNYSFWLQDQWEMSSRLTVNAGVRAENEHIPSFKDQTQFPDALDITFGFKDKIAPRAGFAYDVKGDGKWKAYGSYGWFYTITPLELPRGSFGGDHWVDYTCTLDDPDYTKIQCGEGTTGCPGTIHRAGQRLRLAPQLEPDRRVLRGILQPAWHDRHRSEPQAGEVGRVHGWSRSRVEPDDVARRPIRPQVDVPDDRRHGHPLQGYRGLPDRQSGRRARGEHGAARSRTRSTPKPKRDYDSIELRLNRRWANNWSGQASYLYSRLYGNYSGLASADENGRVSPNVNRYYDHTVMSYGADGKPVYGVLPTDRPHTVQAVGCLRLQVGHDARRELVHRERRSADHGVRLHRLSRAVDGKE